MVSGGSSSVRENMDTTSSSSGLNFVFWARKSINFSDWACFFGQVFAKWPLRLQMKHLLELGEKCLGRLVWRNLRNFHFFWRLLKDLCIFLKCRFFFMGQLQSALSEHLIIRPGRLQTRSIVLSGCNILVKYLCWSHILLRASNT